MRKSDKVLLYVGIGGLAYAAWYFLAGPGKSSGAPSPAAVPVSTTTYGLDTVSRATDPCGNARRLIALGHSQEAAVWVAECQRRGGTV